MKKFIISILTLLFCSISFAGNFREANWGYSFDQVKKLEKNMKFKEEKVSEEKTIGGDKYEWEKNLYSFKEKIKFMGDFDVTYIFLKDKLISGKYSQEIKNDNIENFNRMKEVLTDKYGTHDYVGEKSSYTTVGGKKEAHYTKNYSWYLADTVVELTLVDNKKFEVNYFTRNKDLLEFIKETGLEKQKAKEKKRKNENKQIIEKF